MIFIFIHFLYSLNVKEALGKVKRVFPIILIPSQGYSFVNYSILKLNEKSILLIHRGNNRK